MAAFVCLGFVIGKGNWSNFQSHGAPLSLGLSPTQLISALGVGLIAVFWAYDGWVYITWVAGEVKEPRKNVPLAMVLGVLAVGVIYIAMNLTYMTNKGFGTDCVRNQATSADKKLDTYTWYKARKPATNTGKNQVCELDHLVSLELGGSDTLDNIWPQCGPKKAILNSRYFKRKDAVENFLAGEVRNGKYATGR